MLKNLIDYPDPEFKISMTYGSRSKEKECYQTIYKVIKTFTTDVTLMILYLVIYV